MEPIQGNVSIDAQNIMPIIKKWLYSDKDIFIREVVSNGCDAITKLRMVDSAAAQGCSIHVEVDKAARELRFIDDGVGMTEDEVKTNINQVAFSGAKSFMEEYAKNEDKENSGIIGHFGLGFYSVFMIADQVTIDTLSFREGATPVRWESEDGMAFTMTEGTRTARGTVYCLTVIGQIEGHSLLPNTVKTTKYEHVLPLLAALVGALFIGVGVGLGVGIGVGVGVGMGSGIGCGITGTGCGFTGSGCGLSGSSPAMRQSSAVRASTLHT